MKLGLGAQAKLSTSERRILTLLILSVGINYIDRGTLSVAAPRLTKEMALNPQQMGLLLSGFFWTYALCQILGGWLVERYDVRWVFGIGFVLWSGATFATGLISGFATLFALRLLLGLGESVAYPSYSKIIAGSFPGTHCGIANSLIDMGSKIGPALGTLIGGLVVATFGWRSLFLVIGGISLFWLIPWIWWGPREHAVKAADRIPPPSTLEILSKRDAWGTFLGLFGINYFWYFLLTWLPTYLVNQRHFSEDMMAILGSVPFWGIGFSSAFCGWLSDSMIARGDSPTRVRKFFACTGLTVSILIIPVAVVDNRTISMVLLLIASLAFGMSTSNLWAITQTLAGKRASGKWTGLQNAFGNMAGVTAPYLTGLIVNQTHSYFLAFVAVGIATTIGALGYLLLVGKLEPIEWKAHSKALSETVG